MCNKTPFSSADILLPKEHFENWAVIACDQYTSEPEYWQAVKECVGDKPSALNVILPEVYLEADNTESIEKINKTMQKYLGNGIFEEHKDCLIYVEREQSDGKLRRGIVGKIDLEQYDYRADANAEIRATEQTVLERIPPRVEIRRNAPLELPHVMLLFNDGEDKVFSHIEENKSRFEGLYDFELCCGGGHIRGYKIDKETEAGIYSLLYQIKRVSDEPLFCVGDGNHSLATAKECYNLNKTELSRYALAEITNIHDTALEFEPIYRVVFGVNPKEIIKNFVDYCGGEYKGADKQEFVCVYGECEQKISVKAKAKLSVATLQKFLDEYLKENGGEIDYIHGESSLKKLALNENTIGFLFEGMKKSELFTAVANDGSLPRKTFSMGHADDKRFYIEARRIK